MKRRCAMCALAFFSLALANAQSILTAAAFFQTVSAEYGKIQDYEATADIKAGRQNMEGKISFKRPDLLRIDFSNPENQVLRTAATRSLFICPAQMPSCSRWWKNPPRAARIWRLRRGFL